MMGKKLIAILGITGTQGGSVANAFLKHSSAWHIRGISRNPSSEKAKSWAAKGVEVVEADQNDVESLKHAFAGANAIFTVTDFPSNYTKVSEDKAYMEKAATEGKTLNELAAELEIAQGINAAKAASDPEVLRTLEKFIFSTLTGIKTVSGGKYSNAFQFDSKATIEQHIRTRMPELAERLSTVNLGAYQENLRDLPLVFGPHKEPDGTYSFLRLKWPGPHLAHPEVVAAKDTGVFVESLVLNHPAGTNVLGATDIITKADYAALWGRVMDKKAVAKDVSEEELAKYIPDDLKDELPDFFKFITEYGYTGGNPTIRTPEELGIKTSSLADFFREEDWSKVL